MYFPNLGDFRKSREIGFNDLKGRATLLWLVWSREWLIPLFYSVTEAWNHRDRYFFRLG